MEQQWHEVLLHNDTGDAAFHNGAPLLVEALQVIGTVCAIPSATRLGLYLRDTQQSSAVDGLGATYTERHVYQEHAERIAVAAPLLTNLCRFFQEQAVDAGKAEEEAAVVAVEALDGLLVPTQWAASFCSAVHGEEKKASGTAEGNQDAPAASVLSSTSLSNHPLFRYSSFRGHFDRLSRLVSMGETFSASEPRVKVLQSRYSLYRAYNGAREDEYHPIFCGGDIKRAPKCDLRRLETCMSAASVVHFIEELRQSQPSYPLCAEELMEEDMLVVTAAENKERGSDSQQQHSQDGRRSPSRTNISVEEAVQRFFGNNVNQSERVITEEGLCLRPSYASDSTDHWLSLQRLADSASNPRSALAGRLLQHILSASGGADGQGELLAQLIQPLLKRVLASGSGYDRLELELTVTGTDAMELPRLARWCARSGLLETCPDVYFRFLIVQDGYAPRDSSSSASAGARKTRSPRAGSVLYFDDVLKNIFSPIWSAFRAAAISPCCNDSSSSSSSSSSDAEMQALLARTTGFSVSLTHAATVQEMPDKGDPAGQFPLPHSTPMTTTMPSSTLGAGGGSAAAAAAAPPDAFFVYHIWRNVQLLNIFLYVSGPKAATNEVEARQASAALHRGDKGAVSGENAQDEKSPAASPRWNSRAAFTFTLHGGANSRTLFGESVLGLLLADIVVNPTLVFEWSPLTYLYTLTQRHVVVTPSRNRCCSTSVKQALNITAIPLAVQVGLHVSVATLDPLFYDTTNDALSEELMELTKQRGLANADVTEMCLRSLEASIGCFTWSQRRHLFGYAWPHARARFNQFAATQVSSLRLHHRICALEHELDLVFAAAHRDVAEKASAGVRVSTTAAEEEKTEAETRALLYLPPATAALLDPAATAYRRTSNGSARALAREQDPTLLQNLSVYHAHEAQMQYPRILIAGPDRMGPSDAAKRLMQAMATREAYRKFVVDGAAAPAPPTSSRGSATAPTESGATQPVWVDGVLDVAAGIHGGGGGSSASQKTAFSGALRMPTWRQFQQDIRALRVIASSDATVAKYANKRLEMLESKYKLHVALTNDDEASYYVSVPLAAAAAARGATETTTRAEAAAATSSVAVTAVTTGGGNTPAGINSSNSSGDGGSAPRLQRRIVQPVRGDAHNCVKVDVHCHMASGITAKSLLQFMRRKIREHPDDVVDVDEKTGQPITLVQFFRNVLPQDRHSKKKKRQRQHRQRAQGQREEEVDDDDDDDEKGEDADAVAAAAADDVARMLSEMPIAALQVHAGKATFYRFDRFNHRFSPMGMTSLRSLFLKTENFMQGRYFAELIRGMFEQNELEGNTFTENRLSIYGRNPMEWDRLSRWFVLHGMSHRTNSWMIQVPRLFHLYRRSGVLQSFQEMLTNIFAPLWAASCFPERHPYLHFFLSHVSGFDSVDNESDREPDQTISVTPAQWTSAENPPFAYYIFYMWSNITTLNRYRAARGLSTFQFRPHAGESGDPDHMADVFYLADGIGHGINLDKRPVLQYLYYLAQIPLAVVPMSNNALFCRYKDHPLPHFLYRGLNIAIGTDGALIFHRTEQPLLEEYGTAEALWNLSAADICELAASSVRTSGFPAARKQEWLGPLYHLRSIAGNDVVKSHVPQTRCAFRYEAYMEEVAYLQSRASCEMACRAMLTPLEEELSIMDSVGISREELLARRWAGATITTRRVKAVESRTSRLHPTFDSSQL